MFLEYLINIGNKQQQFMSKVFNLSFVIIINIKMSVIFAMFKFIKVKLYIINVIAITIIIMGFLRYLYLVTYFIIII